jgi:hypothetical protein
MMMMMMMMMMMISVVGLLVSITLPKAEVKYQNISTKLAKFQRNSAVGLKVGQRLDSNIFGRKPSSVGIKYSWLFRSLLRPGEKSLGHFLQS